MKTTMAPADVIRGIRVSSTRQGWLKNRSSPEKYVDMSCPGLTHSKSGADDTRQPRLETQTVVDIATGQDRALLLDLFFLGARRGEVFRLKWDDIDFINNRVRLGTQKTRDGEMRYDWLPLAQELKTSLLGWKEKRPHKTPWVFTVLEDTPSPYNHPGEPFKLRSQFMRKICAKAGVKPFGYHAIRHLHASILFNEGSELSTVQKQLRHTSPTTTVRYLRTLGYEADHGQKRCSR